MEARMLQVGFIGVGQMGAPLARNLIGAGFPLTVFDLDKEKIDAVTKIGAKPSTGPSDLASKSDVVITVLTYPKVVEEVVLGGGGVVEGMRDNAVLIEASSIDHETSICIARGVEARGGRFVESALMGRPWEIEAKQLLFLTAGKEATVKECAPLFNAMGKKAVYVGETGTAKLLKIAFAMLHATETTVLYESLAWSLRNHVRPEAFLEILSDRNRTGAEQLKQMLDGKLEKVPSWTAKDVHHALQIAEDQEIPMPVVSAVNAVIKLASLQNKPGYTFGGMMWKFYEQIVERARGSGT
jgi:3-hydroxyisobutyrate dehydrogenase-like beta-hydroxyacid dehydrogenase